MNERDEKLLFKIKNEAEYLLEVLEEGALDTFLKNRELQYIVSMALIKNAN
ncbi:MAG: hypothetical protein FWF19_03480 [Euryarchaeota archaeon]|nr:hypothetical protein [Euryarchaeota archaeon]